jgi:hypothetical protein
VELLMDRLWRYAWQGRSATTANQKQDAETSELGGGGLGKSDYIPCELKATNAVISITVGCRVLCHQRVDLPSGCSYKRI